VLKFKGKFRRQRVNVPNVMEIWEPKPPGTLWATPGLLRDSLTFTFKLWCYVLWWFLWVGAIMWKNWSLCSYPCRWRQCLFTKRWFRPSWVHFII